VIWLEGYGLVERLLPVDEGLAGQAEHEIQVELEVGLTGPASGLTRLVTRVASAEHRQHRVVERLHAEAQAIGARRAEGLELGEIGVARVALDGDLGIGLDLEPLLECAQDHRDLFGAHQAGRAAAEEDAVHLFMSVVLLQFPLHGCEVGVDAVEAGRLAIEVAVGTDRQTEREVNVERDGGHVQAAVSVSRVYGRVETVSF